MKRSISSTKELIARIVSGPASVQAVRTTTTYRVAVPDDGDPNVGIWITLSADHQLPSETIANHAQFAGCVVALPNREAKRIAAFVASTMASRARPWRWRELPSVSR